MPAYRIGFVASDDQKATAVAITPIAGAVQLKIGLRPSRNMEFCFRHRRARHRVPRPTSARNRPDTGKVSAVPFLAQLQFNARIQIVVFELQVLIERENRIESGKKITDAPPSLVAAIEGP